MTTVSFQKDGPSRSQPDPCGHGVERAQAEAIHMFERMDEHEAAIVRCTQIPVESPQHLVDVAAVGHRDVDEPPRLLARHAESGVSSAGSGRCSSTCPTLMRSNLSRPMSAQLESVDAYPSGMGYAVGGRLESVDPAAEGSRDETPGPPPHADIEDRRFPQAIARGR